MSRTDAEKTQDYTAMGHSVDLITDVIAGNAMAEDEAVDKQSCVDRNVEHLLIVSLQLTVMLHTWNI